MVNLRRIVRGAAVAVAAVGICVLPSVGSAQAQATGSLTVEVVVTGDPGGSPSAVSLLIEPNGGDGGRSPVGPISGASSQTLDLRAGAWVITASVTDPAYVITSTVCDSQPGSGPNRADFIIDGEGSGGGPDASCVINVTYTAPPPSSTTTTTTTTTAPGDSTTTTVPAVTTTTTPGATTTTIDQSVLAPGAPAGAAPTGTIPLTGPTDETIALALTALGALLLGAGALTVARRH